MPIKTDNTTANGITNDTIKQKWSKAMDMWFYWICDCVNQGQYHVYWRKGGLNRANYFTKHHPTWHHQEMRLQVLHKVNTTSHTDNYYEPLDDKKELTMMLMNQTIMHLQSPKQQHCWTLHFPWLSRSRCLTPNALLYKIVWIRVRVYCSRTSGTHQSHPAVTTTNPLGLSIEPLPLHVALLPILAHSNITHHMSNSSSH
jgi:hypothetical protein